MKLRKDISFRGIIGKIDCYLTVYILIILGLMKIYSENLIISLIPACILGGIAGLFTSKNNIYLENSFLYFKRNKQKPSPINDIPIKIENISCYGICELFPKFTVWCNSSDNIILFFKNRKNIVFSVKEKSTILDWLNQNGISVTSKKTYRGKIETIFLALISFCETLYLKENTSVYRNVYLITSLLCLIFWLFYIFSGLCLAWKYSKKRKSYEHNDA
ncbi:MAG: hypothetical protein IJ688_03220 [Treponema sp.]|nr:hypothetical protein [Treponema sp.]